jgi:hypothetical protein
MMVHFGEYLVGSGEEHGHQMHAHAGAEDREVNAFIVLEDGISENKSEFTIEEFIGGMAGIEGIEIGGDSSLKEDSIDSVEHLTDIPIGCPEGNSNYFHCSLSQIIIVYFIYYSCSSVLLIKGNGYHPYCWNLVFTLVFTYYQSSHHYQKHYMSKCFHYSNILIIYQ